MSEWITDRLPTKEDGDYEGKVWITERSNGFVYGTTFYTVKVGTPWQKRMISKPEPYVKPEPQRWKPRDMERFGTLWMPVKKNRVIRQATKGISGVRWRV
jgi:hypothetical protein